MKQKLTERIEIDDSIMNRANDAFGEGPAFYIMTALKIRYDNNPMVKKDFPTFESFATNIFDKTDELYKSNN